MHRWVRGTCRPRVGMFDRSEDTRQSESDLDRSAGAFYTPDGLAQSFAEVALDRCVAAWHGLHDADDVCIRVADIACGDGQLLVAAARWLATELRDRARRTRGIELSAAKARALAERLVSGCDQDTKAVACARRRLPGAHIDVADGLAWEPPEPADLVLINPPFTTRYDSSIRKRFGLKGRADLSVAFMLRAAEIAPRVSVIATKTIAQGDSRECGLGRLVRTHTIFAATTSAPWPDPAAKVSYVTAHLEPTRVV